MPPLRAVFVAATSGALALTAYAILREPPPLAASLLALTTYGALIMAGVFVLRLRIFVDAVLRGPAGARGVALTFDDGPDPRSTPAVLDTLDARGVKATFFVIGKKAEAHPDLVREIVRRGHAVGLHSYAHDRLFSLRSERVVRADLERGMATLESITGARATWFRPPIGHTNPIVARVADDLDLAVVGWSVSARDGTARAREAACLARVRSGLRDGAIVLLHDAAERGDHEPLGPRLLPKILAAIDERNLSVVPLERWVPTS
jgi:peptidoglycan/xylan/chitin deacetylase (PgdA/CDA1 family)